MGRLARVNELGLVIPPQRLDCLEPDPNPPFTGETSAAREFSAVFRLKAYLNGTVLVEKVVKNPRPGVLAGRGV